MAEEYAGASPPVEVELRSLGRSRLIFRYPRCRRSDGPSHVRLRSQLTASRTPKPYGESSRGSCIPGPRTTMAMTPPCGTVPPVGAVRRRVHQRPLPVSQTVFHGVRHPRINRSARRGISSHENLGTSCASLDVGVSPPANGIATGANPYDAFTCPATQLRSRCKETAEIAEIPPPGVQGTEVGAL